MFELHPRLMADTLPVCQLTLCDVRLLNDQRFPWLILVPRVAQITEVHQLTQAQQQQLIQESSHASQALEELYNPDKINIAALGNLVPQLHWHVVARRADDPCWPGPVWGCGRSAPYSSTEAEQMQSTLQAWFSHD